jgi:dipeptidyl aminopeptidase/acylaminoacyl peptidase
MPVRLSAGRLRGWCAFLVLFAGAASAQVDLDRYLKQEQYGDIKISPTGAYYAVTYRLPDRVALVIMRRSDKQVTAKVVGNAHSEIGDFWWVNDERVVVAMAERFAGSQDRPWRTGELHAVNADGTQGKVIVSNYDDKDEQAGGVDLILPGYRYATMLGTVPGDTRHALVSIFSAEDEEALTRVESVDLYSGRRTPVASAPVRRADFMIDPAGKVRFALGMGRDNASKLYYRAGEPGEWKLVNDENSSGHVEQPLGYAKDGRTVYLQVEQAEGPDAVVAYDPATGSRREVARDAVVNPAGMLSSFEGRTATALRYDGPAPSVRYLDPASADAELGGVIAKSFPDDQVYVTSRTRDGMLSVLLVAGARNPGDFYLFDRNTGEAHGIFSRRLWITPDSAAPTRAVSFKARDGLTLHGFLTTPAGAAATTPLPLVVVPHGGPFGLYDSLGYDDESQLLAAAGYAVLRVNYRGSGNYGRKFLHAGERQWGRAMQDDLTDATRWAIAGKVADPARICLAGASYGAYAAMMGLAREPSLYKCGVGYVGVYDLPMMVKADAKSAAWLGGWSRDWIGAPADLGAVSPVNLAASIKAPVLLAAGGKDTIAPVEHTRKLEKALKASGVAVDSLYYPTEGHGFYTPEHEREYYTRLLAFLSLHLGGARAK